MLQHIVLLKFKPTVTTDAIEPITEAAYKILSPIPGVQRFHAGPPINTERTNGHHFGLTIEFDNEEAHASYLASAPHVQFVKEHVMPNITEITSFQINVPAARL